MSYSENRNEGQIWLGFLSELRSLFRPLVELYEKDIGVSSKFRFI